MTRLSDVLIGLALAVACAPAMAEELTLEQRLAAAEERLASLEIRKSEVPKVAINGFITFAMEKGSKVEDAAGNELAYMDDVEGDTWNLNRLTRAGVQFNSQISDKAEAVVQVLGRAQDDFNVDVQWAFVGYDLTPTLTARAGRFVLPYYMHSQYTQVGYAYPWIQLPAEQYSVVPMDTMEGIDLTWQVATGTISHSINIFWGGMELDDTSGATFSVKNQHGINVRSNWNNWTSWLSFSNNRVTSDLSGINPALAALNQDDHYTSYAGIGLQFDNGSLFVMGEASEIALSAPGNAFPELVSGYVTAGYRMGKLTPHLTWGSIDHSNDSDVNPVIVTVNNPPAPPFNVDVASSLFYDAAQRQKSWTLGARYDVTSGVALKAEASWMYDFGDESVRTQGLYSGPAFSGPPEKGEPWIYRLAVESVF